MILAGYLLGIPTNATITDNDAPPTVAWQSAAFSDPENAGSAVVTILLSAASTFTVTVNYATSNGTATAPADYTAASGTLTLSSPSNATLGTPNPATLTIIDDETPPPSEEFYTYDKIGNLLSKTGVGAYSYPAAGSARPHPPTSVGGASYSYDATAT
jgi:hypothetical protein